MKNEMVFGPLSNKRFYVKIIDNYINIKTGGIAILNSKSTTKNIDIQINEIANIEIDTPILKPRNWNLKITQNSGSVFTIPIFSPKQKKLAFILKDEIIKIKQK